MMIRVARTAARAAHPAATVTTAIAGGAHGVYGWLLPGARSGRSLCKSARANTIDLQAARAEAKGRIIGNLGTADTGKDRGVRVGQIAKQVCHYPAERVEAFGVLIRDLNPVHYEAASDGGIVHGMLYASTFSSTFASVLPGCIYLEQTVKFRRPVPIGDSVESVIEVASIRRGIAFCNTFCRRQSDGEVVLEGEARVLLSGFRDRD